MTYTYKALVVEEKNGTFSRSIKELPMGDLPDEEVLVRVQYSSLNYKDALSATGHKGITRHYPHTPGIDAAGTVVSDKTETWQEDQQVIVTSYDLGMNTPGGFGQYIRVPAEWIVPLPENLSLKESMMLGTAGLTAGIGVDKLMRFGAKPNDGLLLVTGATGGVGSLAIAMLAKAGFKVVAATGKQKENYYLTEILGAREIISREDTDDSSPKPLLHGRWAHAFDTVGGNTLHTVLRAVRQNGLIACCGNVRGNDLQTSVLPFILRGISLLGIDSGICKMEDRRRIWKRLATDLKPDQLDEITVEVDLEDLGTQIDHMLNGELRGRILVNLKDG